MSDKDARQLHQMQSQLEQYRAQRIPLKGLINDLEFLLSHVEDAEPSWKQALLSKVGVLEDTYAGALDKAGGALGDADHRRVSSALASLDELIESQLGKCESNE